MPHGVSDLLTESRSEDPSVDKKLVGTNVRIPIIRPLLMGTHQART